jgi:mono/diheme cytochrome c family protein
MNQKHMKSFIPSKGKSGMRISGLSFVAAVSTMFISSVYAGDGKSAQQAEGNPSSQSPSGADLYAINCNRCHEQRYPKEFQATQWTTIMLHMRVRANLTASEAKKILKYLQSQSGT